jgi:hypothetical protein
MFNSPTEFCSECGQWVALDQTKAECAARQQCVEAKCHFSLYFAASSTGSMGAIPAAVPIGKKGPESHGERGV